LFISDITGYRELVAYALICLEHQYYPQDEGQYAEDNIDYPADNWYKSENSKGYTVCPKDYD